MFHFTTSASKGNPVCGAPTQGKPSDGQCPKCLAITATLRTALKTKVRAPC